MYFAKSSQSGLVSSKPAFPVQVQKLHELRVLINPKNVILRIDVGKASADGQIAFSHMPSYIPIIKAQGNKICTQQYPPFFQSISSPLQVRSDQAVSPNFSSFSISSPQPGPSSPQNPPSRAFQSKKFSFFRKPVQPQSSPVAAPH